VTTNERDEARGKKEKTERAMEIKKRDKEKYDI
jgi:hypothetical protein